MKPKYDRAQVLLDAMEQMEEGMLQQAYTTDTPEKFRALGRVTTSKVQKERPVTPLRRLGAVAACLAVTLALAALPWVFANLLALFGDPNLSQQTQPTTTHSAMITQPTEPSAPTLPNTQIRLERVMEIWYHNDSTHLFCAYFVNKEFFSAGEIISVTVTVENVGGKFEYCGTLEDQFGVAQLRSASDENYTIASTERPYTDDATVYEFAHLEASKYVYQFVIPQDAPEGIYILELNAFGKQIRFDSQAELEERYVPCLADLSEEAQKIIARESYGVETLHYSYTRSAKAVPVYGEFGDVFVAFLQMYGDCVFTYETVNGLTFVYATTAHIDVFTPNGIYTLTEAFESGLLNAEQVQQVYDNYQLIGPYISIERSGPYMQVTDLHVTDWVKRRLRYRCYSKGYQYYAGDKVHVWVMITNLDLPTSFYSIKDDIGLSAYLISEETGYRFESTDISTNLIEEIGDDWETGATVSFYYTFTVPDDFQEGNYSLVFKIGDQEIRFDEEAAQKERNMSIIQNAYMLYTYLEKKYPGYPIPGHLPVYGDFGNPYVYIFPSEETDGEPTIETVNGWEFVVPDGYQLYVYAKGYGRYTYTLTEAFEAGIISEEMLQEVYNNYIFLQNSSTFIVP